MEETMRCRAKKKLIRVTFPNGKTICYNNPTDTMVAVLVEIGPDKFQSIKLELCRLPLMTKNPYPRYEEWMKPVCEGWYLNSQSDSETKYMQLRSINEQLNLDLKIELGTDFETQSKIKRTNKCRAKDKLLVKFPDGEFIANNNALDTFLETIWKLGVEDIKRKHLTYSNSELITTTKVLNSQVQIDEHRWIVVPNTTKDKVKLLRVIGAMLHINLEITLI